MVTTRKMHVRPEPIAIPTIAPRGSLLLGGSVLAVLGAGAARIIGGKLDGFMAPAIEVRCAEGPSRPNDGAFAGLSLPESKLSEDMAGEMLAVVVSVSVTNVVDTATIAVESPVTVFMKDVMKMPPTELLCGYQN